MALPALSDETAGDGDLSLTDLQRAFVVAYVDSGGEATESARVAGYADPRVSSFRLLRLAHVQRAIRDEQRRVIDCDLYSLSVKQAKMLLADPDTPKGAKVTLILGVWDRGGPTKRSGDQEKEFKSLEEMSINELESFIREKEAKLVVVPAAPEVEPQRPQTIEATAIAPPRQGGDDPKQAAS